jgi:hypothetical protein
MLLLEEQMKEKRHSTGSCLGKEGGREGGREGWLEVGR